MGACSRTYYCCDGVMHHKSDLPQSLRLFVDSNFSGENMGRVSPEFTSFNTKYRHVIEKLLPEGYTIYDWYKHYYEGSAVIRDPKGRFIYLHYSDVRYWTNEWFTKILIRTMANEIDWNGGTNRYTCLFTLARDIQRLYPID